MQPKVVKKCHKPLSVAKINPPQAFAGSSFFTKPPLFNTSAAQRRRQNLPAKAKSFPVPFLQTADYQQNLAKSFPAPFPAAFSP
jgi:hypothetical protein